MPYDISVKDVPATPIVATRIHTTLATIGQDLPAGFGAVVQTGHRPAGAPFVVYHDVIDEQTDGDIEVCIPVSAEVDLSGDVYGAQLPAATVASTMHIGPYEQVGPAYHGITEWVQQHGHEFAGPPREIYLNDPQTVQPAEYMTEVQWPIT